MAAKLIGRCQNCGNRVWGPPQAKFRGDTIKKCKKCRNGYYDAEVEAERRYFEKFSAEYQMEVQGFVSTP